MTEGQENVKTARTLSLLKKLCLDTVRKYMALILFTTGQLCMKLVGVVFLKKMFKFKQETVNETV